ncbi:hypothetical protein JCM6882_004629 [Rhodosporidiobolus microsporus]
MLSRAVLRPSRAALALRTYATAASAESVPPPVPANSAPQYDADLEPALHNMGYPKLPRDSRQTRQPRGWWDMQERLNYGEPLAENEDLQSMWAPDVHKVKPSSALSQLLLMFGAVGVFAYGVSLIRAQPHALPRGYPNNGLVRELSGTDDEQYAARKQEENEISDE